SSTGDLDPDRGQAGGARPSRLAQEAGGGGGLMSARVRDGTAVGAQLRAEVAPRVAAFAARAGRPPGLGIVLVGDDPASEIYVRHKVQAGTEYGLRVDPAAPH